MIIGLGTGSTAKHATQGIARRLSEGGLERIRAVPTSEATRAMAERLGIELIDLPPGGVDLAIDGMDEVDANVNAIKGLGGALLREKIVASSARLFVLIGDERKPVGRLGERSPVPVEVLPFGHDRTIALLRDLDVEPTLRKEGDRPFMTDNGNLVVDCAFEPSRDAHALAVALMEIPGVLEHGLFLGVAHLAYIADGSRIREMSRSGDARGGVTQGSSA